MLLSFMLCLFIYVLCYLCRTIALVATVICWSYPTLNTFYLILSYLIKYWSGLDNVHIGTIRTILRLIWGISLALSPTRFIKLTHSRMSMGYLEWPGVLFICVWRASACSPSRELCCLDGETGHRACTKNPFWYCGCSSVSLGLRKSHWHIQESRPNAEKLFPLKRCRLLLRLKCIFSDVVGVFHVVYCDDKKKKMQFWICHERHVFIATQIRLHSCYWVSQSLYSWLSILPLVIWPKNIRGHNGCTSYIYC